MSNAYTELIKKRQERILSRERQSRWIWIALSLLAVLVIAVLALRQMAQSGPVNVNTASFEQLQNIPEVGPEIAKNIISERPFSDSEDLLRVKGIGPKTLEKMRPRLAFGDD